MDAGGLGGLDDLFPAGSRRAVGNVFRDGAAEEPGVLKHQGQAAPEAVPAVGVQGHAVHGDGPALGPVEPEEEGDQGGLSRPGGADDGGQAPRRNVGGEVPEDGPGGVIAKGHVVKTDIAP